MDFIRGQIPMNIFKEEKLDRIKLINLVVEICKRNNLGQILPHQKLRYSTKEIKILNKIVTFVLWINENECSNFRTKKETNVLIKTLLKSIINNQKILFYALFCPSYKKDKAEFGFNKKIGYTTKVGIENLYAMYKKAKELGIPCKVKAIFSDLALENYSKLNKEDFKDLKNNFLLFKKYGKNIGEDLELVNLSKVGNSEKKIKKEGIRKGKIFLSKKDFSKIIKRSLLFYVNVLGWKESKVKSRTKELARSCFQMSEEIRADNFLLVMLMTENLYERGIFYHANLDKKIIPIFYPKKKNSKICKI